MDYSGKTEQQRIEQKKADQLRLKSERAREANIKRAGGSDDGMKMIGRIFLWVMIIVVIWVVVSSTDIGVVFVISMVLSALGFYFLPFLIAQYRVHPSTVAIFALNLLAGWTFIGWLVALVWSLSSKGDQVVVVRDQPVSTAPIVPSSQLNSFTPIPENQKKVDDNLDAWLRDKWEAIKSGRVDSPGWFHADPTERQLARLDSYGIKHSDLKRGHISDLIGLFEPLESENIPLLKFFKQPMRGMSQTKARYICTEIRNDPEKMEQYNKRPAGPIEKRLYSFCGVKAPSPLTMDQFEKDYDAFSENEKLAERVSVWEEYSSAFDELQDRDTREDYEIKRVSQTVFDQAIVSLIKSGQPVREVVSDLQQIVDEICELKPELRR